MSKSVNYLKDKDKYIGILNFIKKSHICAFNNCIFIHELELNELKNKYNLYGIGDLFKKEYQFIYTHNYFRVLKSDSGETLSEGNKTSTEWEISNKRIEYEPISRRFIQFFLNRKLVNE